MAKKRRDDSGPDDEAARLYSLPLDRFVSERDAAAKRLRESGDGEGAKRVKALRKPSVPAAAINRAVAADPAAAKALIAAGERLEQAQAEALSRGDADSLREAVSDYGEAIERLMEQVDEQLAGAGGPAAADRARETLRAAAGDEELRSELVAGTLVRDREAVGLGGAAPSGTGAKRRSSRKPAAKRKAPGAGGDRKRAEQTVRRAERELDAATERAAGAERRLERARRALSEAEDEHEDAVRERERCEGALAKARKALAG